MFWPLNTDLTRTRLNGIKTLLLFEVEDHSVDHEGPEHEEDAGQHPHLDGGQSLGLGGVGVDVIEDVDEDKEEGDEERHAAGDDVRGDEEGDPGDQDEEAGGEVVGDDVGHHVPRQILRITQEINLILEKEFKSLFATYHFKSSQRKVPQRPGLKYQVLLLEPSNLDVVVEDDGLGVLDVAQSRHIKHHPGHVIGVAPNLRKYVDAIKCVLDLPGTCTAACPGGRSQRPWDIWR